MASVTDQLEKLMVMLDRGLITREQFDQQRDALLSAGSAPSTTRPSTVGSYRITGEIGVGGMGRVYRGRHRTAEFAARQGGDVAIKVLHAQHAERADIVERFEREAALGIKLDHPGIVRVHELVVDAGRVALVMEVVEGRPMSEMIGKETGPIPWARAKPMVEELLDAVRYAHGAGVVHRDLKPENVMVSPEGRLKVLDFGIAKDLSTGRTKTGTGMGTVDYMAPEQYIDAKNVDARADIYALGMTVYEMLAGRLPWDEASEFSILEAKKNGQIPPPTDFYPDIPPEVVAVVMKMLRPAKEDRYADAAGVEAALKGAEDGTARREVAVRRAAEAARKKEEERAAEAAEKVAAAMPAPVSRQDPDPIPPGKSKAPMLAVLALLGLGAVGGFVMLGEEDKPTSKKAADKDKDKAEDDDESSSSKKKKKLEAGDTQKVSANEVSFTLAYAPKGSFEMGSPSSEADRRDNETQHTVTLSEGFHIGTTEVTQGLYAAVTGAHPWRDKPNGTDWDAGECYHYGEMAQGDSQPAYCVSWYEAVAFCNALSKIEDLKPAYTISGTTVKPVAGASGYRLPTEAEWEYAARAGETHTYAGSNSVDAVAWYKGNSDGQTHPVGTKDANAWGLHDMSGNVFEWTGDWKGDYPTGSVTDPPGAPTGGLRVNRGGCFDYSADWSRAADRDWSSPVVAVDYRGFRVVLPE